MIVSLLCLLVTCWSTAVHASRSVFKAFMKTLPGTLTGSLLLQSNWTTLFEIMF